MGRSTSTLLIGLTLGLVLGCSDGPKLGNVNGTITFEGEPLYKATVTFTHVEGQTAFARTDEKGYYELQFSDGRSGAKLGKNAVAIETGRVGSDESGNVVEFPEILPAKFHAESDLTVLIEPGDQVCDFQLEE